MRIVFGQFSVALLMARHFAADARDTCSSTGPGPAAIGHLPSCCRSSVSYQPGATQVYDLRLRWIVACCNGAPLVTGFGAISSPGIPAGQKHSRCCANEYGLRSGSAANGYLTAILGVVESERLTCGDTPLDGSLASCNARVRAR